MSACRFLIRYTLLATAVASLSPVWGQTNALVNTSKSSFARLESTDLNAVKWTTGFWADRFAVCRDSMVPHLWDTYTNPNVSHAFRNFEIAAGLESGNFKGPSFHDGDFYKTLESVASMYALTKDKKLDEQMDRAIAVIAKAQAPDGYVYTKAIIQQKKTGESTLGESTPGESTPGESTLGEKKMSDGAAFRDKLSFEAYNFGHLMTAACVHYRATGKTSLLNIAKKATDFLIGFYDTATPEQARNAICPSHYMGITEMYRTTHDPRYLTLAKKLIDIRGLTEGTDDNSDRVPFRQMKKVIGHAVRANYLFAGAADVFAETGDSTLLATLDLMWNDVVNRKMYVTGGCGALYDGVSPEGTSYKPDTVQKIHQAYGKAYQLPNHSAHNETCANIGNLLWNYRMLQITGQAKYADVMELELYNAILSGVNLGGTTFFYTNPLSASDDYPYQLRWMGGRQSYIRLSNCCPPNTVRTMAEVSSYAYSISDKGLWVNLFGGSQLTATLKDGAPIRLTQTTNYPWDGVISLQLEQAPAKPFSVFVRIPGWCQGATIKINGVTVSTPIRSGEYAEINRVWKAGDKLDINLPMPVKLIESNPLVEENRNQVAVKRGPLVYCLESVDNPKTKLTSVALSLRNTLKPIPITIKNSPLLALEGDASLLTESNWTNQLYREVSEKAPASTRVRLIPYYAWANRGHSEMEVWIPFIR
ncbi:MULTISPECIES: glycoside hydrolase family 127 protein [unclassified Spirosoma]|uniref:aceric acid hydrolase n=1 Tax=unclassified Spirosoma TaxID=2621999 RepID=UPI00096099D7|nr:MULTISPECIES: glycoside hydrolase family 127 protein [unclassified Spirosoma]MBN8822667.1 glycoside hydrolase family 127 protein [Spirosoma sp.]OJW74155.1 MAG: ATP-binding protein [Spirosoma sp. 48-14]